MKHLIDELEAKASENLPMTLDSEQVRQVLAALKVEPEVAEPETETEAEPEEVESKPKKKRKK